MVWDKGKSGNPAGRPKGASGRQLTSIKGKSDEIINRVIMQARDGCIPSQKMVMDRIVAPLKPVEQPVILVGYPRKGSVMDKANFIVDSIANGKISVSQGTGLVQALGALCKIKECTEFEDRLKEIEKTIEDSK